MRRKHHQSSFFFSSPSFDYCSGPTMKLALFCALFGATMAAKSCHVFPTTGGGTSTTLDCTSVPGHSAEKSGCFYRKFTDDSDVKAGTIEGGCGAQMCRGGGAENCRFLMESEDGPMATSNFCCCYDDDCNTRKKAETVGGDAMF